MLVHIELKHINITPGNCIPLQHIDIVTLTKLEIVINKTSNKRRLIDDVAESNSASPERHETSPKRVNTV